MANTPFVHIQSKCFDGGSERPPSLLEALSHCIPRQTSVIPCGLPQYKYTKFLLDQLHIKINLPEHADVVVEQSGLVVAVAVVVEGGGGAVSVGLRLVI